MFKEKLAVIIPTKDRHEELRRLLKDISTQEIHPEQIVIVDGGATSAKEIFAEFPNLKVDYVRKIPASLTAQRNEGIRSLREEISLVAFFDDDVVLEDNSLCNMMKFWEGASPETGGAAFNLTNEAYKKPTFFEKIFFVNANTPNRILRSGFQSKVSCLEETLPVQWLPGCAMVWRKSVFNEFLFDEWFSGYARYEEVDFSYRAGKKYKLYVAAEARIKHLSGAENENFSFSLGKMEIVNRFYFVKKNRDLSLVLCSWALFGFFLNNVFKGIFWLKRRYLLRAAGNTMGFLQILFNKKGLLI